MADQGGINLSHRVNTWKANSREGGAEVGVGGAGGDDSYFDADTTLVGSAISVTINKGKAKMAAVGEIEPSSHDEVAELSQQASINPPSGGRTTATFAPHRPPHLSHSHSSSTASAFSYATTSPLNLSGPPIPNISSSLRYPGSGRPSFATETEGVASTSSGKGGLEMSQISTNNQQQRQPSLKAASVRSQKSSVAPDTVFGTKAVR